ncbi:MAG: V-type ATPase subunit subunit G family protein [Halobacteriota archaeon]
MADVEPSLLQQIRKREVELSVETDQARREAEQIVAYAKREAAEIIKKAENDGQNAADELYKKDLASIFEEVEKLKQCGEEEAKSSRLQGEQHLSEAIDLILTVVTPE